MNPDQPEPVAASPGALQAQVDYLLGELLRQGDWMARSLGQDPNDDVLRNHLTRRAMARPGTAPDVDELRARGRGPFPDTAPGRAPYPGPDARPVRPAAPRTAARRHAPTPAVMPRHRPGGSTR